MTTSTPNNTPSNNTPTHSADLGACRQGDDAQASSTNDTFLTASFGGCLIEADTTIELGRKVAALLGSTSTIGVACLSVLARSMVPVDEQMTLPNIVKYMQLVDDNNNAVIARTPKIGSYLQKVVAYNKEFPYAILGQDIATITAANSTLLVSEIAELITESLAEKNLVWKSAQKKFSTIDAPKVAVVEVEVEIKEDDKPLETSSVDDAENAAAIIANASLVASSAALSLLVSLNSGNPSKGDMLKIVNQAINVLNSSLPEETASVESIDALIAQYAA